jgi:hypothetical protein
MPTCSGLALGSGSAPNAETNPKLARALEIETRKAKCRRMGPPPGKTLAILSLQRLVEERQADIHSIVDVGMVVVELLVAVLYSFEGKLLRQDTGPVMDVVLVAPAAVDVDPSKGS